MSAHHDEVTAMQVETDEFMLSLTSDDVNSNGPTEEITTHEEVTDLPPDLVHADVSELATNPTLWLGLEGSLESSDVVSGLANTVSSVGVTEQATRNQPASHELNDPAALLSHSEEVETMSIEAMEVDVQTSEVSQSEEISSIPMEGFMDQASSDLGINVLTSSSTACAGLNVKEQKKEPTLIPVTLSLQPTNEPAKAKLTPVQQNQQRKTFTIVSSASANVSQVTKVVLAPASSLGQQSSTGQQLIFTVPSSSGGLTSILTPNTNLRLVNTLSTGGGGKALATVVASSSGTVSQPVRLMSPTKTITLQQAQQLGLLTSPKKGQPLVVSKVPMSGTSGNTTTIPAGTILTGKTAVQGSATTKFAGGNVTLVRSIASSTAKVPAKIAPAPPQSTATATVATATAPQSTQQQQPTSLLIKNAAGQVTMATLVSARPSQGVTSLSGLQSPHKFVIRPAAPGAVASTQVRHGSGTQPAQYIRLTTAQALAAGILPTVGNQGDGTGQQLHVGGNKIQLVRVVTPAGSSGSGSAASSGTGQVVIPAAATTVKLAVAGSSSQATAPSNTVVMATPKTVSLSKSATPVKNTSSMASGQGPAGTQRILLPAGPIGTNLVVVPAQYVSQGSTGTTNSNSIQSTSTSNANTLVNSTGTTPTVRNVAPQVSQSSTSQHKSIPVVSTPASGALSPESSKAQAVLESNGLKPRKPCNCTKSQCLKLYCDCFANGEFCHGCNCVSCANNLEHEELRLRAIRSCLDRNPHAFKPKIGVGWGAEPRRHNKGCHCKRSGCLKNYCECYEAKIACSAMCKCIGCKNCVDPVESPGSAEKKSLSKISASLMANQSGSSSIDGRSAGSTLPVHNIKMEDGGRGETPKGFAPLTSTTSSRPPFSFITQEVVEATCQCLLAQAEEAERLGKDLVDTEGLVLEEFGRCLLQIIEYASKAKGIQI